ncbi:hypothetical protein RHSIM_Rhsim05G0232000 [Rhododendron simsii]|uniref:mannan endo-1,4-beta-mannosidase n=1 Tax=Rhododendron simsii TaxID=118357 RepID=A0A834GW37_RHOSS|nr:hypothetical protein RHSIM_Rhsim05G0232000 [Rhododendron simsii]
MGADEHKFRFKTIFWKSIYMLFCLVFVAENLSYLVSNVNGYENLDRTDGELAYFSINQGICEIGEKDDDAWTMVRKKGNQFVVNDQPFYVNGFNTYWLMVFAVNQSTRGKVTEVFQQASSVGLTVCRTWAFSDGNNSQWPALQKLPSVYDEEVFKALDFVVSEAKKYKIRLILPLTNNWGDYGGKLQYVNWGKAAGLNLTSKDEFFSHPTVTTTCVFIVKSNCTLSGLQTVLNRVNTLTNITYKDDPTIFAWELMNEPRCDSDPSGDTLQAWIEEMAVYVKRIDPRHLVGIGLEGFYGPSTPDRVHFNANTDLQEVGTDFIRNHQVLGVDFASAHIYADSWVMEPISDAYIQFVKAWMQSHIEDAENALGMPVLFGEFGVSSKDPGGSGGGSLLWQLFPEGTDYMDDGLAIVLSKSPSTSDIISRHSKTIMFFNSFCSWKCHWGCKKKHPSKTSVYHDDL